MWQEPQKMNGMNKVAIWSLLGLLALLIAGTTAIIGASLGDRIFIGDDDEAQHTGDAVITAEEAKAIAENHLGGTAISVELENEDGYLVYGVHIVTEDGQYDVKIDAGTGEVLKVDNDD